MKRYLMGTVKALDDGDDPNGSFEVILSAPTLDRDGEVIDAKAFEPLPDHVTFDIDHGMSVATTVGSGAPAYDDEGRLRVKGTYSSIPRAQEVRTLVREGHIRTTSVAFMDAKREQKDGVSHIVKAELLNGAFVPIPSNRESVVVSAKEYQARVSVRRVEPVRKFAGGQSANQLRESLTSTLRETYGALTEWVWVRDFDEGWVVFEVEDADHEISLYRQTYTAEDGAVTLSGDAEAVIEGIVVGDGADVVDHLAAIGRNEFAGDVAGGDEAIIGVAGHVHAIEHSDDRPGGAWRVGDEDDPPSPRPEAAQSLDGGGMGRDAIMDHAPDVGENGIVARSKGLKRRHRSISTAKRKAAG